MRLAGELPAAEAHFVRPQLREHPLRDEDLFSSRAGEVADDLLAALDVQLRSEGLSAVPLRFRLDGSSQFLDRARAEHWIRESVDAGLPHVRFYIEDRGQGGVVVNLAAFEDPDSQYYP